MHRGVDQDDPLVAPTHSLHRCLTTMRRTIIHDIEQPIGIAVRLLLQNLIHQSAKRLDPRFRLATPQDYPAMHVPRCQVLQRSLPLVFRFNPPPPLLLPLGLGRRFFMTMPKARKIIRRTPSSPPSPPVPATPADRLLGDIRSLIEAAREQTARAVNSALVGLYWHIGKRVREDVLLEKRAEYGERIVETLAAQMTAEYGRGFDRRNLFHMIRFAEVFPDEAIVNALRTQLSWTHFRELLPIDDPLKREFYAEMCRIERWSTRTRRHKIGHLLYERTAVSKKPEELIAHDLASLRDEDRMTPDLVFRDPCFLDFLGLTGSYFEKDVEQAILRELETFILELGSDFTFVARQKRVSVDSEDYYLDLLFYHRRLRRLVAIDLYSPSICAKGSFTRSNS
jgi:predicted nuclease of restriction endonuclease-like (RecB) superfamily